MRRLLAALTLCLSLLLCPVAVPVRAQLGTAAQQDQKTQTIYVTRTGKKCQRDGCRYQSFCTTAIPVAPPLSRCTLQPARLQSDSRMRRQGDTRPARCVIRLSSDVQPSTPSRLPWGSPDLSRGKNLPSRNHVA
jgi:hypothetical protein